MASNCAFSGQLVGFDIAIKECTDILKMQNIIAMATQRLEELNSACNQHLQQAHPASEEPLTNKDTHGNKRKWVESGTDDKKPRADTEQLDSALVTAGETAATRQAAGHSKKPRTAREELRVVEDADTILHLENALTAANACADGFAAMYTQKLKNTVGATLHASEVKLQVGRLATALKAAKDRIVVLEAVCASHSAHTSTGADRIRQLQSDFDDVFMAKVLCETDLEKEKERADAGAAAIIELERELSNARAKVSSLEKDLAAAHINIESLEKDNADLAAAFDTPEQSVDNGTTMQQLDSSRPAPLRSVTYGSVAASRVHSSYNVSEAVEGLPLLYKSAWVHERMRAETEIINSNRARYRHLSEVRRIRHDKDKALRREAILRSSFLGEQRRANEEAAKARNLETLLAIFNNCEAYTNQDQPHYNGEAFQSVDPSLLNYSGGMTSLHLGMDGFAGALVQNSDPLLSANPGGQMAPQLDASLYAGGPVPCVELPVQPYSGGQIALQLGMYGLAGEPAQSGETLVPADLSGVLVPQLGMTGVACALAENGEPLFLVNTDA